MLWRIPIPLPIIEQHQFSFESEYFLCKNPFVEKIVSQSMVLTVPWVYSFAVIHSFNCFSFVSTSKLLCIIIEDVQLIVQRYIAVHSQQYLLSTIYLFPSTDINYTWITFMHFFKLPLVSRRLKWTIPMLRKRSITSLLMTKKHDGFSTCPSGTAILLLTKTISDCVL